MSWGDLLRYTLLIAVCLGALGLIVYVIRKAMRDGNAGSLMRDVADAVLEIRAAAEAKKVTARKGKEEGLKVVQTRFAKEVEALNEKQAEEAKALHEDPVALSRFLVRAGRKPK